MLRISHKDLLLDKTLKCGQAFRWRKLSPGIYRSAFQGRLWTLTQLEDAVMFDVLFPKEQKIESKSLDESTAILRDYLNLDVDLQSLYKEWGAKDPHFYKISNDFRGIRMLRQDPLENLLSFICSTNNNISRITTMVETLSTKYGKPIAEVDGHTYYDFPELDMLQHPTLESELRSYGFGYRAKFIANTTRALASLPVNYLEQLRGTSYEEAHTALMGFSGVGPKVADCVALMSLDKTSAIPVDTHVLQIAQRDYKLKTKDHLKIKQFFRDLWGDYAGWAHSVLFTADLKAFQVGKLVKSDTNGQVEVIAALVTLPDDKKEAISDEESIRSTKKRRRLDPTVETVGYIKQESE